MGSKPKAPAMPPMPAFPSGPLSDEVLRARQQERSRLAALGRSQAVMTGPGGFQGQSTIGSQTLLGMDVAKVGTQPQASRGVIRAPKPTDQTGNVVTVAGKNEPSWLTKGFMKRAAAAARIKR